MTADLQGFTPIWFIYIMASVQLLQLFNASINFPIYWFVGNFRETFLKIFCRFHCTSFKSSFSSATDMESANTIQDIQDPSETEVIKGFKGI